MTPTQRTVNWLRRTLEEMPSDIRMVYLESCEYWTPDHRPVASFGFFGFRSIPSDGFDPDNADHVGNLGYWDFEANPSCDFPDFDFDMYDDWLQVLETAVRDRSITDILRRRDVLLLFADHDGPVSVVSPLNFDG